MSEQRSHTETSSPKPGETRHVLVDLGGPVIRVSRTYYIGGSYANVTLLVPAGVEPPTPASSAQVGLTDTARRALIDALSDEERRGG